MPERTNSEIPAEDRVPSPEEYALLLWLLEHGNEDSNEYVPQLNGIRVVGRCGCGCPTIDLAVFGASARTVGPSYILADFVGKTPDGRDVGVLLHVRENKLSELEVYDVAGGQGTFSLPLIESLKPF
jgi:hypothetical protein